jgi:hypothetical protein
MKEKFLSHRIKGFVEFIPCNERKVMFDKEMFVICVDDQFRGLKINEITQGKIYKCIGYHQDGKLKFPILIDENDNEIDGWKDERFIYLTKESFKLIKESNENIKLVICVRNDGVKKYLTVGKIYKYDDSKTEISEFRNKKQIYILNLDSKFNGGYSGYVYVSPHFIEMPPPSTQL